MMTRRQLIHSAGLAVTSMVCGFSRDTLATDSASTSHRILTAKPGIAPISSGRFAPTDIWGYDGQVPGPVLRVTQGDRVKVRLQNDLEQPTSIHWHGIRIANAMDGSPLVQEPVVPGDQFDYDFIAPDAGTYWYHTHTRSFEQLERGLYGMLIVEEPTLPANAFDDELLFVIDDWLLKEDGSIDAESLGAMMHKSHGGRIGNVGTVNGQNKPELSVRPGARLRVRVLNACNARIVNLHLPDVPHWVIAFDGQPVETLEQPDSLVVAPGQRIDLVMDMPAKISDRLSMSIMVRDRLYDAAWLVASKDDALSPREQPPERLPNNPALDVRFAPDNRKQVTLTMEGGAMGRLAEASFDGKVMGMRDLVRRGRVWAFNGVTDMESQEPLFKAKRGETVELTIDNQTAWPHAMHLHGHHFRVVKKDGEPVKPGPWRDTHLMQRGENITIALVTDNPGDWLIHCHMAEHSAAGMVGWFKVG